MSFKERMQQLSSADDLRDLMEDLAVHGSPHWTWDAAAQFVPSHLWGELSDYFDDDGRLRRPVDATASFSIPVHSLAESLSEIVAGFHLRLADARTSALSGLSTLATPRPHAEFIDEKAREALEELVQPAEDSGGPSAAETRANADPGAIAAIPRFLCPICEVGCADEPVWYRGTRMCASCADLIRVD